MHDKINKKMYKKIQFFPDLSILLTHLHSLRGEIPARARLVRAVIEESKRFKRKRMATQLEAFLDKLIIEGTTINGQTHL
jgi:hypothetical protein